MRKTIRDVAEAAGVAKSTVSIVMNNSRPQVDRIPVSTRDRIRACAESLGYSGSRLAAALSTGRSLWIGVITDCLPSDPARWTWAPFFDLALISGIQRKLAEHGYFTLLGLRQVQDEVRDIDQLASAEIGGLILKAAREPAVKRAERLLAEGTPVVNVFPIRQSDLAPCIVDLDNVAAGRLAAELVIGCNCRNPVYFMREGHIMRHRAEGFVAALQEMLGVAPRVCSLPPGANDNTTTKMIVDCLCDNRPDIAVALDAGLSMLLSTATDVLSVEVPRDLAIIGFDCMTNRTARQLRISSVGASWLHAGETAAQIIVDRIEGINDELPKLLPPVFVPGDTTPPGLTHKSAEEFIRALDRSAT